MTNKVLWYVKFSFVAILCSAIVSTDKLSQVINDRNIVQTTNGAVRLGKVHQERLMTDFTIRAVNSDMALIEVTSGTPEIYEEAYSELVRQVDSINKDGGVRNEKGVKNILAYKDVVYKEPIQVKTHTYIIYKSENFNEFHLTIDKSEYKVGAEEKPVIKIIDSLKTHSLLMATKFAPRFLN